MLACVLKVQASNALNNPPVPKRPQTSPAPQVGENFSPCELPEDASSALAEAISACKNDASLFTAAEDGEAESDGKISRDALEALVSAACEAGPVEGAGAVVREAAAAVKKSFADALAEEKEKVQRMIRVASPFFFFFPSNYCT